MPPDTNRGKPVRGPCIPLSRRVGTESCQRAVLDTLAAMRLSPDQTVTAEEVQALMSESDRGYLVDTVYKTMRRMAGNGLLIWQNRRFAWVDPTAPLATVHDREACQADADELRAGTG